MIAKNSNLMYRLNMQVTANGRQPVPDRGVVRSYDALNFWGLQSCHCKDLTQSRQILYTGVLYYF